MIDLTPSCCQSVTPEVNETLQGEAEEIARMLCALRVKVEGSA